VSLVKLEVW